jgi:hypothetical protein
MRLAHRCVTQPQPLLAALAKPVPVELEHQLCQQATHGATLQSQHLLTEAGQTQAPVQQAQTKPLSKQNFQFRSNKWQF